LRSGSHPSRVSLTIKPPGAIHYLHELPVDHPAVLYLRSRGYDTEYLGREMYVGYCDYADDDCPMASNRLVVPIHMSGQLRGWQARYVGTPPSKQIPKYYNMPYIRKKELLYNYDVASQHPFVVVMEGVTDVWRFGPEGVCIFGHKLSSYQAQQLAQKWKTVVILLDNDPDDPGRKESSYEIALEAYDALRGTPHRVICELPEKRDPGDLDRDFLRQMVYQQAKLQGVLLPMGLLHA